MHIQRQYGVHTLHQRRSDGRLFVMNTQFAIITFSRLFWACLGRWCFFILRCYCQCM